MAPPQCSDMEMAGTYPNCYFPQYLHLNATLARQVHAACVQMTIAAKARTVTQAMVSQVQSLLPALVNHLLVTSINEGLRQQWIGGIVNLAPSQTFANVATNWANTYGVDPTLAENAYWASSPNLASATASTPSLQQQILNLPLSPGTWDNINAIVNGDVMSVQSPSLGTLICNELGGANQLQKDGAVEMAAGTFIDYYGPTAGPAAPYVEIVGTALQGVGALTFLVGTMCEN